MDGAEENRILQLLDEVEEELLVGGENDDDEEDYLEISVHNSDTEHVWGIWGRRRIRRWLSFRIRCTPCFQTAVLQTVLQMKK